MARLFISYRRSDSQHAVDRLYERLKQHVADAERDIFMDVDNIPLGVDFVDYLSGMVGKCDTLLAIIGPSWLEELQRRADDPKDFVRIEIEAALARDIPVVPILLDDTRIPREDELPDSLKLLSRRNGSELRRPTFNANVDTLARKLGLSTPPDVAMSGTAAPRPAAELKAGEDLNALATVSSRRQNADSASGLRAMLRRIGGGAAVAAALLAGGYFYLNRETSDAEVQSSAAVREEPTLQEIARENGQREVIGARLVQTLETSGCVDQDPGSSYDDCAMLDAAFSPDGTKFATASWDDTARIWNEHGEEVAVLRGHEKGLNSVAFSPDGTRLVTASWDGTSRIWTDDGEEIAVIEVGNITTYAAFSPDGERVVTASADGVVGLWTGTGELVATLVGHGSVVSYAAFSANGERIITTAWDGTVRVWTDQGEAIAVIQDDDTLFTSANLSLDGKRIATTRADRVFNLWTAQGDQIAQFSDDASTPDEDGIDRYVGRAAFSPDGNRIVTAFGDGEARLRTREGEPVLTLGDHEFGVTSAAFSPDGAKIVTTSWDNIARVWELVFED